MTHDSTRIGLAGWSEAVSRSRGHFPQTTGTGLERYSSALNLVEVNVSFYRQVRRSTYESWAEQTPEDFAFSVKMSRAVTHFAKLSPQAPLDVFWESVAGLGDKLRAVLVQLPPSLALDASRASDFFARMRTSYDGLIAVEPRHDSWRSEQARTIYVQHQLTEVATAIPDAPSTPDTPPDPQTAYYRLHGEPRRYRSPYSLEQLERLATVLRQLTGPALVVFDNTATSAGVSNALALRELLEQDPESAPSD